MLQMLSWCYSKSIRSGLGEVDAAIQAFEVLGNDERILRLCGCR